MNSGPAITPARRKRLLKAFRACPAGYTNEDLERFLDLLYSMFSDVYTLADERRFQAMLRSAWQKRSWHVLVADPGSGKTMGIVDFVQTTGSPAGTLPGRSYPTLAVSAGADWIPKFVDYHRQDAVRILDAGPCHGVCGASGPSRPRGVALPRGPHHPGGALPPFKQARFQQWLKQQRHELKTGEASKVLAELSRLQTLIQESHVESAVETITKKLAYVRERQAMLTYAT